MRVKKTLIIFTSMKKVFARLKPSKREGGSIAFRGKVACAEKRGVEMVREKKRV